MDQEQQAAGHNRNDADPAWRNQASGNSAQAPAAAAGQPAQQRRPRSATEFPTVIAIDGPAGAGKSTIGRLLAERLGYLFFDTGAMYRAITWAALEQGVPLNDEAALSDLAYSLPMSIRQPRGDEARDGRAYSVFVRGQDVTQEIRKPAVEDHVSQVSAWPTVREALVIQQRKVAENVGSPTGPRGIVMAGRDIGTVVLPDADLKIYLDASPEERARRRNAEMAGRGMQQSFEETLDDIRRRDHIDSTRAASPLRMADDAVGLTTDGLSIAETMAEVMKVVTASHT